MIEERLAELGIELPAAPVPVASYIPVALAGELAFVAGQIPIEDGRVLVRGKVGAGVSVDEAVDGTRRCALQAMSALREALGSLDRVRGIVQVNVYVASAEGFSDHSTVANGASDLLVEVFGDEGRHARAAVGVAELPLGAAVEVALTARIA
ncbi:MAG TPA: RidA family protein [Actinomycetota bacterium]|jgi:enamine deaminase RidA (YjgF/YER057c/UK114 family)